MIVAQILGTQGLILGCVYATYVFATILHEDVQIDASKIEHAITLVLYLLMVLIQIAAGIWLWTL